MGRQMSGQSHRMGQDAHVTGPVDHAVGADGKDLAQLVRQYRPDPRGVERSAANEQIRVGMSVFGRAA